MNFDKLIVVVILSISLAWCGRPLIEMKMWQSMDEDASEEYTKDYAENLTKETLDLVRQLANLRGESLNFYESDVTVLTQVELPSDDPELALLLSNPDVLPQLGLHEPMRFSSSVNLRDILGTWRFWTSDDSLRTLKIDSRSETGEFDSYGPKISIKDVRDSIVFRIGTNKGDWILYLPGHPECKWLSILGEEYCSTSLHSWLAASIVGAESRWDTLEFGKLEVIEEMKLLPESTLEDAINKLVGYQQSIWNTPLRLEETEPIEPYPEWHDVLKDMGENRPPPILNAKQTYRPKNAYSAHSAFIQLWKDNSFQRVRVDPRDYRSSVVVLSEPYGGARVLQTRLNEEIVYIDIDDRVAFYSFIEWVQWAIATENVNKWKLLRKMPPNAARFPIG